MATTKNAGKQTRAQTRKAKLAAALKRNMTRRKAAPKKAGAK